MTPQFFWAFAYVSLCSFRAHPGTMKDESARPTREYLAKEADLMLDIFLQRFPEALRSAH